MTRDPTRQHCPKLTDSQKADKRATTSAKIAALRLTPAPITAAQRAARATFDLDAAMAALPPYSALHPDQAQTGGRHRLRGGLRSGLSPSDLRDLARELGAQRVNAQYLDALCIVVGNQARAERFGYVLELNVRVPFTSERTMRTILHQMKAAGITFSQVIPLGHGRSQLVQCFGRARPPCPDEDGPEELERSYRQVERDTPEAPVMRPPVVMPGIPEHVLSFGSVLTTQ